MSRRVNQHVATWATNNLPSNSWTEGEYLINAYTTPKHLVAHFMCSNSATPFSVLWTWTSKHEGLCVFQILRLRFLPAARNSTNEEKRRPKTLFLLIFFTSASQAFVLRRGMQSMRRKQRPRMSLLCNMFFFSNSATQDCFRKCGTRNMKKTTAALQSFGCNNGGDNCLWRRCNSQ